MSDRSNRPAQIVNSSPLGDRILVILTQDLTDSDRNGTENLQILCKFPQNRR
ncbi:MAG: hypothetical protein ACLFM4_03985 [Phormidium sp.]